MNATPDNARLFLALWPDDTTRNALLQLQGPLQGRLIPYANLHLTLAFLGPQPLPVIDLCKDILVRITASPVMLRLDKVGYFARNRVAWVGAHSSPPELVALHEELAAALAHHGLSGERQQFKPHVTLARDATMPMDMTFTPIDWHAEQLVLVQSRPSAAGSIYDVIASRSLADRTRAPDESGTGSAFH